MFIMPFKTYKQPNDKSLGGERREKMKKKAEGDRRCMLYVCEKKEERRPPVTCLI
jgi:hypothetical protein